MRRPPPTPTLFPYTTLFRSDHSIELAGLERRRLERRVRDLDIAQRGCIDLLLQLPPHVRVRLAQHEPRDRDRKSTRLNSSHGYISYAVFCLKKKKNK